MLQKARSPTIRAMFRYGSKFRKQLLKGLTKEHFSEIISKSDERFQKKIFFFFNSLSPYSTKRLTRQGMVYIVQNLATIFLKGSTTEHLFEII